jgi:acyl carrier protein
LAELEAQVLEEIRRVAREELDYCAEIQLSHRLHEDLQLDSMAMIVVATELENRFRVMLAEEDAGVLATVEDLVRLVLTRLAEAPRE